MHDKREISQTVCCFSGSKWNCWNLLFKQAAADPWDVIFLSLYTQERNIREGNRCSWRSFLTKKMAQPFAQSSAQV